jgi:soluble lytic murein transglycosylase-like protein
MDRKTTFRRYTSAWQGQTASLPRTLVWARLTEVPLPFWSLALITAGLAGAAAVSGVPMAGNPEAAELQTRVSLLAAEVRDLRSNVELKVLEIERLQLIQDYSTEFSIPAHRARQIYDIALAEGVNPQLAFNLVRVESGFRRTAVSPAGAIGYTQIRPSTARWLDPKITAKDLFNTGINLHLGFRYFRYLLDEYNGDTRLALLAYNRGPTRVGDLLTSGIDPANGYAQRVLGE